MIKKYFLFGLLFLLCAGCSSDPENLHDMLLYVSDNYEKNQEKTIQIYKSFGEAGEEALIRTYFGFKGEEQPFYTERLRKVYSVSVEKFTQLLAEDKEFLRRIISLQETYSSPKYRGTRYVDLVLEYDKELFLDWFLGMSPKNPDYTILGNAFKKKYPNEALHLGIKLLEQNIEAVKKNSYKLPFSLPLIKKTLTPDQYHFIFSNKLDLDPFAGFQGFSLPLIEWLRVCPEDFPIAVWRRGNIGDDTKPNVFVTHSLVEGISFKDIAPEPSGQGNKTMIFYDGTQIAPFLSPNYHNPNMASTSPFVHYPGPVWKAEFSNGKAGIPLDMMQKLPKGAIPGHMHHFDKVILVTVTAKEQFKYNRGASAMQFIVSVDYINPHPKKSILSSKVFYGGVPQRELTVLKGTKYVTGSFPMKDVVNYIQQLVKQYPSLAQ